MISIMKLFLYLFSVVAVAQNISDLTQCGVCTLASIPILSNAKVAIMRERHARKIRLSTLPCLPMPVWRSSQHDNGELCDGFVPSGGLANDTALGEGLL